MKSQLEIVVRARGVALDAGVADAPLVRVRDGRALATRLPIDLWILPEGNALTATVSPMEDASEAPLIDLAIGAPGGAPPPVVRVAWSMARGHAFEPFRVELPFAAREVITTHLWREALEIVELDDVALDRARSVGLELYDAMATRDLDAVTKLVRYRTDETARALGFERDENDDAVRASFESFFQSPGYELFSVRRDEIRVAACAGGRVFHLTRDDGRELVTTRATAAAREQTMQVYVSQVEGAWRVVR